MSCRINTRNQSGFLLIEVVLAMAILVLVTVGMYKIMAATVEAASEIRISKVRTEEINGLISLCRRTLNQLHYSATITSQNTSEGGRYFQELVIEGDPHAFAFGPTSTYYGRKILALREQLGGLQTLNIFLEPEELQDELVTNDVVIPPPLTLLNDVRKIEWLFFDERISEWMESWDQPQVRPKLIKLILTIAGEPQPYEAVFHVPAPSPGPTLPNTPAAPDGESPPTPGDSPAPSQPQVRVQ